jgi:hypothetical protein
MSQTLEIDELVSAAAVAATSPGSESFARLRETLQPAVLLAVQAGQTPPLANAVKRLYDVVATASKDELSDAARQVVVAAQDAADSAASRARALRNDPSASRRSATLPHTSSSAFDLVAAAVSGLFAAGKGLLVIFGLFLLVGGWTYGHSPDFRVRCAFQKLGDTSALSFPKNFLCDAMFDVR